MTPDCIRCQENERLQFPPRDLRRLIGRMIVCPECGNKRCPKATYHNLGCTGSNEPGQPGSAFPAFDPPTRSDGAADTGPAA